MKAAEEKVRKILDEAGITIGGSAPQDIAIHDERFYERVLAGGSLALGESYMDGWWDARELDQAIERLVRATTNRKIVSASPAVIWLLLKARLTNRQSRSRAFQVGEEHYDVGNDLYEKMLDTRMTYTCGYWSGTPAAANLEEAQEAKLDLICRKLKLKGGERILDIGCGWGSFAFFAAEKYGAQVVGLTVSKEQVALGNEKARASGLPVEFRLTDYRDLAEGEQFDRVVSVGMFEHVGYKNYRTFMEVAHRALKDDGLFLLHTIGGNLTATAGEAWHDKYIFPNGMLPSIAQMGRSIENLFVMEDWHNFGSDYEKTLMAWFRNFDAAWPELREKYGGRFYRMWKYYLLSMAGAFRSRQNNQLWQIVLSKSGVHGGYRSAR